MEKKIISFLRKYEDFLTYRGISLIDRSEYELILTKQTKILVSPIVNFVKQCKMLMRHIISKPNPDNKGKVLFLIYTHSHINTSIPIIKMLKEKALVVKRDGFTNNVAKELKQRNIAYNDIEGYFTKESSRNIRKARKPLKNRYKELLKTGEFDKQNLGYLFLIYFPEMIRHIEIINNMLSFEKPKLFVVLNEKTTLGDIAVALAKQRGIKTMCIQHGAMGYVSGFVPVAVDKIAVWGNSAKRALIHESVPKEKIVITGAPQFDNLTGFNAKMEEDIKKEINLDPSKKYILFTTQTFPYVEEAVRCVCKAVKSIPSLQLVIKTHPSEYSTKKYERIIKESRVRGILTKKYLHPLMKGCSAMLTVASTTGFEALIMGKPLIIINLSGKPDVLPYAESGAAIGVYKPKDIKPAIKSVLENQNMRKKLAKKAKKFIYEQCYKLDNKDSERVVKLINKMIDNKG